MTRVFEVVGNIVIDFFYRIGESVLLLLRIMAEFPRIGGTGDEVVRQMMRFGIASLPLIAVTNLFTGMVMAVQTSYQIESYVPDLFISAALVKSVVIELSPVLTALVMSGRVGASFTAELGTMRATEQIDAMETMALDPVRYLLMPRMIAGLVMMPVITTIGALIAIGGGYVICLVYLHISHETFIEGVRQFLVPYDLYSGLFKAYVFGGTISLIGCYYGFCSGGGAEGVGQATTRSVVTNCLLILILDYVLAMVLFPSA